MTRRQATVWGARLLTLCVAVGLWVYGNGPGGVSPILLPKLPDVLDEFASLLTSADNWLDVRTTIYEIVIAGTMAVTAGLGVGFIAARSRFWTAVIEPMLAWGYLVPLVLFYPVFILWFGVGSWSKIACAGLAAFFPIAYNAVRAFSTVDPEHIRVGVAFGASPVQIDWLIKFRAGIPVAAAGLRIGAATTFIMVIVTEMLSAQRGLGYELARSSDTFQRSTTFAITLFVMLIVGVFQYLVTRALPKPPAQRSRGRATTRVETSP